MNQFTVEQIQEKFDKLPDVIKDAISSPDIKQKVMTIGNKYGLMIDEIGELVDQVGLVMLGLAHPNSFVNDTAERLSISHEQAKNIAEEINSQVFSGIKAAMQNHMNKRQEDMPKPESNLSPIEKIGNFTLEDDNIVTTQSAPTGVYRFEAPKADVPKPQPIATSNTTPPTPPKMPTVPVYKESLVDQMMRTPTAIPQERVVQPPANLPVIDPYREPPK